MHVENQDVEILFMKLHFVLTKYYQECANEIGPNFCVSDVRAHDAAKWKLAQKGKKGS